MTRAPNQFWIISHPESEGPKNAVAQFETSGETLIPDEIANHDKFEIQELSSRDKLVGSVDHSNLTDYEKEILKQVYPIQK